MSNSTWVHILEKLKKELSVGNWRGNMRYGVLVAATTNSKKKQFLATGQVNLEEEKSDIWILEQPILGFPVFRLFPVGKRTNDDPHEPCEIPGAFWVESVWNKSFHEKN